MAVPQRIRASGAVAQAAQFSGSLPVAALPRLRESLARDGDAVEVSLKAGQSFGRKLLQGTLRGLLSLQCRRCDKIYAWPLDVQLDLRLVENEDEERALLEEADPYWVRDDQLPLHELVEDEVLLALPMLPRCPTCETKVLETPLPPVGAVSEPRENPFAALKERFKQDQ